MDPGWERDVKFHEGWDLCLFGGEDGVNGSGGSGEVDGSSESSDVGGNVVYRSDGARLIKSV